MLRNFFFQPISFVLAICIVTFLGGSAYAFVETDITETFQKISTTNEALIFQSMKLNEEVSKRMLEKKVEAEYKNMSLIGEIAYVYNKTDNKVLFEKNAELTHPLASITKLMTALVASETFLPDESITITNQALQTDGEYGLIEGEEWKLSELTSFMLTISSNDAAKAIEQEVFRKKDISLISLMNARARDLDLDSLFFRSTSGLDQSYEYVDELGATSTTYTAMSRGNARDIAGLAAYILDNKPALAASSIYPSRTFYSLTAPHYMENTNETLQKIDTPLLSKTGFTLTAGGNLVFAFRVTTDKGPKDIIAVILGSTKQGRFTDAMTITSSTERLLRNELQGL